MFETQEKIEKEPQTLRELVDMAANKYGNETFFRFKRGGCEVTKDYYTVRENSFAVAQYIHSISTEKMHIALLGSTSYEYIVTLTAIMLSGCVVVPLSPDATQEDIIAMLQGADVDMLIYENKEDFYIQVLQQACPKLKTTTPLQNMESIFSSFNHIPSFSDCAAICEQPEQCAVIMYTSGTTGIRKGAMLSTKALISNMNFKEFSFTSEDTTLSVLPMHHIFAFSCDFLKNFKDGVTVCLNGSSADIVGSLLYYQPTMIRLVPVMIETILKKINIVRKRMPSLSPREAAETVVGSHLRWIIASGAYLKPSLVYAYEVFGITLRAAYGMTEAGPRIAVPDGNTTADSVGRIISIVDARIQNGEIQVHSDSLMLGYYKMPLETAEMFTEDGWLRTGDMGRIAADGQLYITGRLKNLIILSNGVNVSPEILEKKCLAEPLVNEVLVYEEDDHITAEFFTDTEYAAKSGFSDLPAAVQELVERVNDSVPTEQHITRIKLRDTPLLKTNTGKILRKTVQYA